MGKVLIPGGGGGGAISDDITLRQSDVPVGLTAVTSDSDDEIVEGTLTTTAAPDKVLKDETFYNTETHQKESGTIESMGSQTITPGASAQTVSCTGKYMTGDVIINAVAGLSAGNIANGVTVGGVAGTYKGLGNATQAQVLSGSKFSTASLSNASGTMTNYSGYTSTSNYVSSTFRSGTTGYVFASPGGTGYYTTGSYLRIPATNLAAGNIKKGVTILGITGTYEGWYAGTGIIYNRGTWGSGWNSSKFNTNILNSYSGSTSLNEETSALRVYMSESNGCFYFSSKIDLTPYKTVNFIISGVEATGDRYLYLRLQNNASYINHNNQYNCISYNCYYTGSEDYSEKTVSINVSNINVSCYISISLRATGRSSSSSSYIHKIWFT